MDLSIIIVSWNVREKLETCLKSLFGQVASATYEVIVVDNASGDQTPTSVLNNFPQARLIANEANLGFAKAVNQGASLGTGNFILLLNPDTQVKEGSLDQLLAQAKSLAGLGVLGGQIRNPDGTIQLSVRRFPTLAPMLAIILKLPYLFERMKAVERYLATDFDYTKQQEVDQVMGAYFLVPRLVWDQLQGMDE
ncbi:glycosyltransferase, partial [Candidatus Uhrbacteria bacterium]|nr:glycosyltransferase [Candidatus Uhrbacteria bacterium]